MTLKLLMKDIKIKKYMIYIAQTMKLKKKIFDIIIAGRCLKLGFEEFIGCKKNIKKTIKDPSVLFDYKLDRKNVFLLKTILDISEGKNIESEKFSIYFPKLSVNDLNELNQLILNQELYYRQAKEILKKIQTIEENQNNQNPKNENQEKSKNNQSKKKKNLKQFLLLR